MKAAWNLFCAWLMAEQIIAGEEASGDPELVRIAAQRRRWIGMPPQAGERHA